MRGWDAANLVLPPSWTERTQTHVKQPQTPRVALRVLFWGLSSTSRCGFLRPGVGAWPPAFPPNAPRPIRTHASRGSRLSTGAPEVGAELQSSREKQIFPSLKYYY